MTDIANDSRSTALERSVKYNWRLKSIILEPSKIGQNLIITLGKGVFLK